MQQARDPVARTGLVPSCWWASLVAQRVKNLPARWETWVWSLSQEDPMKQGMATHSGIPAWTIPCTEQPDGLQSTGSRRVGHDSVSNTFTFLQAVGRTELLFQEDQMLLPPPSDLLLSRAVIPKEVGHCPQHLLWHSGSESLSRQKGSHNNRKLLISPKRKWLYLKQYREVQA